MMKTIGKVLTCILVMLIGINCGYGNLDYVKANSESYLNKSGFRIVAYQGYSMGVVIPYTEYGGASVWYNVIKNGEEKTLYQLALRRWGDEIHIYNLTAVNAIKGN